jgi:hypothetical protein
MLARFPTAMMSELDVWRCKGTERYSGAPFSLLCAADEQSRRYLSTLAFDGAVSEEYWGRLRWPPFGQLNAAHADLLFARVTRTAWRTPASRPGFFIPCWVSSEVGIPWSPAVVRRATVKSDLRKIRQHGFRWQVTTDPTWLDRFYFDMHVPFVTSRHGETAYVISRQDVVDHAAQCELLLIWQGELAVGGVLIAYDGPLPRLWSVGVREGDGRYVKRGVIAAAIQFAAQHLTARGYHSMSLGRSRGFLRDGALQFKNKWHQRVSRTSAHGFAMIVLSTSYANRAFLHHNPFIEDTGESLRAVVFREQSTNDALAGENIEKQWLLPGLSELVIYDAEAHLPSGARQILDVIEPSQGERRSPEIDADGIDDVAHLESAIATPPTETERWLSAIWCEVLALPYVGVQDDFFDLGGDSLLGMEIVSRSNGAFEVYTLFELSTIRALARFIDQKKGAVAETPEAVSEARRLPGAAPS